MLKFEKKTHLQENNHTCTHIKPATEKLKHRNDETRGRFSQLAFCTSFNESMTVRNDLGLNLRSVSRCCVIYAIENFAS